MRAAAYYLGTKCPKVLYKSVRVVEVVIVEDVLVLVCERLVRHVHLVNGKQVNIPSYLVKAGDVIEIKENKKGSQRYKEILEATAGNMVPEWLEADAENLKGTVKELPAREAIDVPVDEMLIVELYSK